MMEAVEVYTFKYEPFTMGGELWQPVKTTVEQYEPISLAGPCIVFENPVREMWHVAVVKCGAIVATESTRDAAVSAARSDCETGDKEIIIKQIENGIKDRDRATLLERGEFFRLFK